METMEVKIVRSRRRRRTVSARLVRDTLEVRAPLLIPQHELARIVADFKVKFERKKIKDELDRKESLLEKAARINEQYFDDKLTVNSIEYVTDQSSKFGCCNYRTGNIRISHRVGLMPAWVRDYVILHEMAHLLVPAHNKEFWDIVSRYKLTERARGYLIAVGLESESGSEIPPRENHR
ncbi:MAG: M48 family metallopeptidase [Candidatus Omnitrophica bacterium]|nr:M48 family metallopeptidase [Candidatus Omnitrophota bacterium]